jgi:AcrR family transcriptional regulator
VSQVAEAAEVSESTFFRYFATKEAVALWDEFDPQLVAALRAQPPDLAPIPALRAASREVFDRLTAADREALRQRTDLVLSVPELRAASLDQFGGAMRLMAEAVAERVGRSADDFAVRVLVGATVGAYLAAVYMAIERPGADVIALMDEAMAHLEAGLPL